MKIKRNWWGLFGSSSIEIDSPDMMWSSSYKPVPATNDENRVSSDDLVQKIGPFFFDIPVHDDGSTDALRCVEVPSHIVKKIIEAANS